MTSWTIRRSFVGRFDCSSRRRSGTSRGSDDALLLEVLEDGGSEFFDEFVEFAL